MAAHTGPTITGNVLSVDTTAGGVVVVGEDTHHRTVIIQNLDSTNPVYVGGSSGLTTANGFRVAAGESFTIDVHPLAVLHAVAATAVSCRFLVETGVSAF